jgi:hypothetical protein
MKFREWVSLLSPPKDYQQSTGSDIADSIGLIVICALLLFVVFI